MTESLRNELAAVKANIKVTVSKKLFYQKNFIFKKANRNFKPQQILKKKIFQSISPAAVRTGMLLNAGLPEAVINQISILETKDVLDAVIYVLATPPNVQVASIYFYKLLSNLMFSLIKNNSNF